MSFMEETIARALPIWDACGQTPFVQGLKNGTLPSESFKCYMIQDSIYLKHYARLFGKAIYLSTSLQDIQQFYGALCFVTDSESALRLRYLQQFGLTDEAIEHIRPLPQNERYIAFMLETARRDNLHEILMAVLPCMQSYSYIARRAAADPGALGAKYRDFILDYADDRYCEDCERWSAFADGKCGALPRTEQERLQSIFETASLLELDFWSMALDDGAQEVKNA